MQMAMHAPISWLLLGIALVVTLGVVAWSARKNRRYEKRINELVELARVGRAEQARIQARNGGRELAPLLSALSGDLTLPSARAWGDELLAIGATLIAPVLFLSHAFLMLRAQAETRVATAAALLFGLAILAPVGVLAAWLILELERRAYRTLRGACVTLMAKSAKASVDAEVADALRRGLITRDPRGE